MLECGFSLTFIFAYNYSIVDFEICKENVKIYSYVVALYIYSCIIQWKHAKFSVIFWSESFVKWADFREKRSSLPESSRASGTKLSRSGIFVFMTPCSVCMLPKISSWVSKNTVGSYMTFWKNLSNSVGV